MLLLHWCPTPGWFKNAVRSGWHGMLSRSALAKYQLMSNAATVTLTVAACWDILSCRGITAKHEATERRF